MGGGGGLEEKRKIDVAYGRNLYVWLPLLGEPKNWSEAEQILFEGKHFNVW